jgi:hypothetical protein
MTKVGQLTMPPPEDGKGSILRINFRMGREPNLPGLRFPPADKNRGFAADEKSPGGRQEDSLKSPS